MWFAAVCVLVLVSAFSVTSISNEPHAAAIGRAFGNFRGSGQLNNPSIQTGTATRRNHLPPTSVVATTSTTDPPPTTTDPPTTTTDPPTTTTDPPTTTTDPPATIDLATNPSGAAVPGPIAGWTETFTDNFTSPSTLSNYQVYGNLGAAADGSGSCFSANHVAVTGGELVIKGYQDPAAVAANGCTGDSNQWVTGGVKLTSNSQTYGKYEVRMRVDNGQGVSLVALLWPTSDTWPPEIDFAEDSGGAPRTAVVGTEHWGTSQNPLQATNVLTVNLTQWHTMGVEWSPGKIVYTMDGVPWATETNANVSGVPMQLAFQTEAWQCGVNSWEQCANSSTPSEVDMDVDWIAVYSLNS